MRIIARSHLVAYWTAHAETKASLSRWEAINKTATWQTTAEVIGTFPKAKALDNERVRFEVAGGNYRLIAAYDFARQVVFIKFIGTHAEYDRIDALTVSLY